MDQLIVNAINQATKPNKHPQTPTKLTPRFKTLARECGFVFWDTEAHGPGPGNIDWSSDYTQEFEKYSRELVSWACHMVKLELNSGKDVNTATKDAYRHLVVQD